eukprot:scaffold62087_cov16-Tisochrysis_lutea.AAC.3
MACSSALLPSPDRCARQFNGSVLAAHMPQLSLGMQLNAVLLLWPLLWPVPSLGRWCSQPVQPSARAIESVQAKCTRNRLCSRPSQAMFFTLPLLAGGEVIWEKGRNEGVWLGPQTPLHFCFQEVHPQWRKKLMPDAHAVFCVGTVGLPHAQQGSQGDRHQPIRKSLLGGPCCSQ